MILTNSGPAGKYTVPVLCRISNAEFLRSVKFWTRLGTAGKYTVPVLWDKVEKTIVNNESAEILRMFNYEFNKFAKNPDLDLYPEELRQSIDVRSLGTLSARWSNLI